MIRVAALLTVYNRKAGTMKCLARLLGPSLPADSSLDVYLTDDGCTDGTGEAVRAAFPKVRIVPGDGTLFWNRGMIAAWRAAAAADYDYYLWLNDDTFTYDCLMGDLLRCAAEAPEAIIVGATQALDHSGMTYGGTWHGRRVTPCGAMAPLTCFNGNIVLVPRSAFRRLGYLDAYFRHSCGDYDYGMRAVRAGIRVLLAPRYLGECDLHPHAATWCDPEQPLRRRWRALYRPNGMPPNEIFHLERRHRGLLPATFHFFTVHLRCLAPQIWALRERMAAKRKE